MKWYIVRHAEKEKGEYFNPVLRHQDEPISTQGLVSSKKLWEYFSSRPVNRIYISQYKRTRQTIDYAARKMGISPLVDSRLNEIDNGLIDKLTDEEIERLFPDVWKGFLQRDHDFTFPQGESGESAHLRIESFMHEKSQTDEDILIVCHEGLIRLWLCHILGLPVFRRWDFKVDFCGILEIEFEPAFNKWKLIRFNQSIQ